MITKENLPMRTIFLRDHGMQPACVGLHSFAHAKKPFRQADELPLAGTALI
jgi:hypothetical protein